MSLSNIDDLQLRYIWLEFIAESISKPHNLYSAQYTILNNYEKCKPE